MPTFQFEAMDSTGAEIKDVIDAPSEEDAQATIRQMGYFVTKITVKKSRKKTEGAGPAKKKRGVCLWWRQVARINSLYPSAFHSPGCRPADPPQPENPCRTSQTRST